MKGFEINDEDTYMVVFCGRLDLSHISHEKHYFCPESISKASEFCQLSLLVFMIENGGNISGKDENVKFLYLI